MFGWLIAIILGFVARSEIKQSGGQLSGGGQALAGIILGFMWPVLAVTVVIMAIAFGNLENSRSIDNLAVGECVDHDGINNVDASFVSAFATVRSCDEPHDAEVLHVFELNGLASLTDDEVLVEAANRCEAPFEELTGERLIAPGGHDIAIFWRSDTVICLVVDELGAKLQAPVATA